MPDQVTGTGADGTTAAIESIEAPVDREDETLIAQDAVLDKDYLQANLQVTEIEDEDVDVYGISFPKSMLPIGADQGYWTSEPLLDLDGDEDEALVRVWLHAPAYKWPQKEQHPPGEGV